MDRREATAFYKKHSVNFEWHYIDISNDLLIKNLNKRNREIEEGRTLLYYFEYELANKFWTEFEPPAKNEIDVWVNDQTI